jgi:DNA invertase Pin-like site-specific DNA recombinase
MDDTYIAYYRVSTQQQGRSGLGLEAQRNSVSDYLKGTRSELLDEFTEIETGKGANALDKRPQLRAALDFCKKRKATLLVAKLDRLARNVHFLSGLMESGVKFIAVDMPDVNRLTVHVLAAVAEHEREMISLRTRDALAAARLRGVTLGTAGARNLRHVNDRRHRYAADHAQKLRPILQGMRARGLTQRAMVSALNELELRSPRGGTWYLATLQRLLARLTPLT